MQMTIGIKQPRIYWRTSQSILSKENYFYCDRWRFLDFLRNLYNDILWEIGLFVIHRAKKRYVQPDDLTEWRFRKILRDKTNVYEIDKTIKIIYGCLKLLTKGRR